MLLILTNFLLLLLSLIKFHAAAPANFPASPAVTDKMLLLLLILKNFLLPLTNSFLPLINVMLLLLLKIIRCSY